MKREKAVRIGGLASGGMIFSVMGGRIQHVNGGWI